MKEKTLPSVRRKFRFGLLKSWLTFGKCRLLSEKEKKITPPYWTWIMKLQKIYINMKLIIFYQSISILRHRFRLPINFLTEGAEAGAEFGSEIFWPGADKNWLGFTIRFNQTNVKTKITL